jgi:hypothetical protein
VNSFWVLEKYKPGMEAKMDTAQVMLLVMMPKVTVRALKANTAWTMARYLSIVNRMMKKISLYNPT